jgi:PIN domain nuclease of toxin-antitoxin system
VKYLLDTHALIWFFNGDEQLSKKAALAIADPNAQKYASIASVWELAIKTNLGKMSFEKGAKGFLDLVYRNNFKLVGIESRHVFELEKLPHIHKDPFDRILIATAVCDNMQFITRDELIQKYPIAWVW